MDVQIAPTHLRPIGSLARLHGGPTTQVSRVFGSLCLVLFLIAKVADDDACELWRNGLTSLLTTPLPPTGRTLSEIGFPRDWQTWSLWH